MSAGMRYQGCGVLATVAGREMRSMLTESEKRAAALAVSRYGVDRARIKQVCLTFLGAKKPAEMPDLLDALVSLKLLTSAQASDLRLSLDSTHLDTAVAATHEM